MEATSLVCVGGVAVLYSGRWFALSSRKARVQGNIGQRTLAWAKNHLRYLACGHTLQPLCNRLCSHDRNHLVWTDGGHSSSTPEQGQPLQAQIAFQQEVRIPAFQQWPHLLAERWSVRSRPNRDGLKRVGEMSANECNECRFGPERAHSFCVQEHDRQSAMAARNKLESPERCERMRRYFKVNLTAHEPREHAWRLCAHASTSSSTSSLGCRRCL